jgi:phage gp45-like
MDNITRQLAAKIRNLFSPGDLKKRNAGGSIRVETVYGAPLEKKEAFPYGFKAKAKKGKVLILCRGGNFDGFEILPVLDYDGGPPLEEGDTAIYSGDGGWIICRDKGAIEIQAAGTADITIQTKTASVLCKGTGDIEIKGTAVSIGTAGKPAARTMDQVMSTPDDDPAFWQWITTVSSALAALTGGSLTPPVKITSKITGGSTTVTIG